MSSEPVETIGVYDLSSQRLSGREAVIVPGTMGFEDVSVLVTVDIDGKVIEAEASDSLFGGDPAPALAEARRWRFRPQSFDGHPIRAIGKIRIAYDPPEIPTDTTVPFPATAPGEVEIVLRRSACFGNCPDYLVSVTGTGKVRFSTLEESFPGTAAEVHRMFNGQGVLWPGTHEASVSPQAVAELIAKFRDAHFMGLNSEYAAGVTDNPTYSLTLRVGNQTKKVIDYVGKRVGMPASVTELEEAVDALAGTDRWVNGNAETVALLKAQDFDFKSKEAAEMVQFAIEQSFWLPNLSSSNELIQAALAAGLDLSIPVEVARSNGRSIRTPIGVVIISHAVQTGNEALFEKMVGRGQVARMSRADLDQEFLGGMGCSPKIARALVSAGANPKATGDNGNSLHEVRDNNGPCSDVAFDQWVEMVGTLVELGVPLEARNYLGRTPLMGTDTPEIAQILLKAGANPNARSPDQTTPLLSISDDRVGVLLLRAGADPGARDENGTFVQQRSRRLWPGTFTWLEAHGIRQGKRRG